MGKSVSNTLLGMALLLPFLSFGTSSPARAAAPCNDVALVLAVDASASVSPGEFLLQTQGIAAAFRDPEVLQAIQRAGRVMVAAVIWGSEGSPKTQTDWVDVADKQGAEEFARTIQSVPRQVTGDTGLGAGLITALVRLTSPNVCAVRKIINVSGDGEETRAVRGKRRYAPAPQVRDLAQTLQVEINALAILNEEPDLAAYYSKNVITGPDAFVMQVSDYQGFAAALRRKLIREISPRAVAVLPPTEASDPRLN